MKKGNKVVCVNSNHTSLIVGEMYIIEKITYNAKTSSIYKIKIVDHKVDYYVFRFKLLSEYRKEKLIKLSIK